MTVDIHQLGPDLWEQRLVTTAQPDRAFDYIANFEKHIDWERELVSVKSLKGRTGRGAKYVKTYVTRPAGLIGRIFSSRLRVTCLVREVERPWRIAWKQYRSHQASAPSGFQRLEFVITPHGSGSLIVLTRRFTGSEAISADAIARFSSRWGRAFQGLPPEVRAAAGSGSGDRPGPFSMPGELVRQSLDGHPSRGPGPTSLERLKAILDGGNRHTVA